MLTMQRVCQTRNLLVLFGTTWLCLGPAADAFFAQTSGLAADEDHL